MTAYTVTFTPDSIEPLNVEAPYLDALVEPIWAHVQGATGAPVDGVSLNEDPSLPREHRGTGLVLAGAEEPASFVAIADLDQFL